LPTEQILTEDQQKQATVLRKEFDTQSKEFIKVRDAYGRILKSAEDPSPAGDLALIFNYMKMLDPGSTVREGEFANAQNSGGLDDTMRAKYNSVIEGTRLTEGQREDFVNRSGSLYEDQEGFQKDLMSKYEGLATQYDVPSSAIVSSLPDFEQDTEVAASTLPSHLKQYIGDPQRLAQELDEWNTIQGIWSSEPLYTSQEMTDYSSYYSNL
jgi:hypothetical protein